MNENLAIIFPGQGSQKVGMLADFADRPTFKAAFDEASEALGYDVWGLIQSGPQEELNMTEITQPVMLTSSIALWRLWNEDGGVQPALVAGHSLGEWTALVASGVVKFADAVTIVRNRGKYMQEAVAPGEGAMAAIIGVEDEVVEKICEENSNAGVVSAVNYNSPGQLVIAGNAANVESAIAACKEAGAKKAMALPVSAPFHTSLMKPAADRLESQIMSTEFSAPTIPVVHNVHAQTESDPEKIKQLMVDQVYSPVRWVACFQHLAGAGIQTAVECGPGKVLTGLARRIDRSVSGAATETPDALSAAVEASKQ